eukprot:UN03358
MAQQQQQQQQQIATKSRIETPSPAHSAMRRNQFDEEPPQQQKQLPRHNYVKALYAYTADPSQANVTSLTQGEIYVLHSSSGDWWSVSPSTSEYQPTGQQKFAPSNYLQQLNSSEVDALFAALAPPPAATATVTASTQAPRFRSE